MSDLQGDQSETAKETAQAALEEQAEEISGSIEISFTVQEDSRMVGIYGKVRKYGKQIGCAGLAAAGSYLVGKPAIDFALDVFHGKPVQQAANDAVYNGFGYNTGTNKFEGNGLAVGATRTVAGVAMIGAAKILYDL